MADFLVCGLDQHSRPLGRFVSRLCADRALLFWKAHVTAALSALRVYAISNRSMSLALATALLALFPVATNIVSTGLLLGYQLNGLAGRVYEKQSLRPKCRNIDIL